MRLSDAAIRMYDVSVPLSPATPVWPGDPPVVITPVTRIGAGDECNVSQISLSSHAGTHVDVPWHFDDQGKRLDEISLDAWLGECYVADFSCVATAITAGDLGAAAIPPTVERLLLRTVAQDQIQRIDNGFSEQFVGLAPDAADWVITRGIRLVGIDTPSIEPFDSPGDPVHHQLLGHEVLIIESLDLTAVPIGRYQLICLPLKLIGVDGAPARVLLMEVE